MFRSCREHNVPCPVIEMKISNRPPRTAPLPIFNILPIDDIPLPSPRTHLVPTIIFMTK